MTRLRSLLVRYHLWAVARHADRLRSSDLLALGFTLSDEDAPRG